MKRKRKLRKRGIFMIVAAVILIAIIAVYLYFQDNLLQITKINITSSKINSEMRIVQLSDLHGKQFGKNNSELIKAVNSLKPDVIMFTGDLIDVTTTDITPSINTLIELNKTTPVFYIAGNHEHGAHDTDKIIKLLKTAKVNALNNETRFIKIKDNYISILGIDELNTTNLKIHNMLLEFEEKSGYRIILSHYPENFHSSYKNYNIDLVMSGHAHGGQVIIPFIGGVYAPGQGFFPKYYQGLYNENNVNLIVSRGLGNSRFPFRINNRPEIVVLNLYPKK